MGLFKSQPTNGAGIGEVKSEEIENELKLLIRYFDHGILPQIYAKNNKVLVYGIEKAREDITEIVGHLNGLLNNIVAVRKTLVKGYSQVMDAEALISKALTILRTQWDKDLQNILFEVRNNRYTGGPKSKKLKKAEESKKKIPGILRLFMKEEGARSIDELRRKLEKSRNWVIQALEYVTNASEVLRKL